MRRYLWSLLLRGWASALLAACGPATTRETTPAVGDDPFEQIQARWRAHGIEVVQDGEAFLEPGGRSTTRFDLVDGCTLVFAVAAPGIGDLDATLYAPEGDVLGEDVEPDPRPIVRYCGEARPAYYVVHAYAGAGTFRWVVARGSRQEMDWVAESLGGAPPIGGSENASIERTLRERGFERVVDRRRIQLVDGEDIRFPVALEAHECVTVLASADEPITLRLETDSATIDEAPGRRTGVQVCDVEEATGVIRGRGIAEVLVVAGRASEVGGPSALWLGAPRARSSAGVGELWRLAPAEVRSIAREGCGHFEASVELGTARLTLRSGGRELSAGSEVEGEICEAGVLTTDAPARVRWRWRTPND